VSLYPVVLKFNDAVDENRIFAKKRDGEGRGRRELEFF